RRCPARRDQLESAQLRPSRRAAHAVLRGGGDPRDHGADRSGYAAGLGLCRLADRPFAVAGDGQPHPDPAGAVCARHHRAGGTHHPGHHGHALRKSGHPVMIGMDILQPVVALAIWTMVMWAWMYATRIPAMNKAKLSDEELSTLTQAKLD